MEAPSNENDWIFFRAVLWWSWSVMRKITTPKIGAISPHTPASIIFCLNKHNKPRKVANSIQFN